MALKDHNLEAYKATKDMLMTYNECCLVAGTGIGKSNISTELINELKLNTLVIAPTNSIKDNWANMPEEYDIPPMISTVSYQLFSANPEVFKGFDMYIFDECHHIGSNVWGNAVKTFKKSLDNGEYVLGLTADSIRYLDYEAEIKDVAYSVFDGHVVYGLDSKEAIELGILPKATYICALYNAKEYIEKYENMDMTQELRGRLALTKQNCESIETITNRHAPKDAPLKGIVFVDSIDRIKSGVDLIKSCFPGYEVNSVHSKMKNSRDILDRFKYAESGFMVSVNMISEGMHFKGVNVIIMLRKTQSPSLYIQQIGRGLTSGGQNPVIFDLVRNDLSIRNALLNVDKFNKSTKNINIANKLSGSSINPVISDQSIIRDYATDILSVLKEIEDSDKRWWTEDEDRILREFYPSMGPKVFKKLPGRTKYACAGRVRTLNIKMDSSYDRWSKEEDDILIKNYPTMGYKVSELLPGRTDKSCAARAKLLNLKTESAAWSDEEDEILRKFYPTMGSKVAELIPGRTESACTYRASKLNIKALSYIKWSEEEDEILRKFYPSMGSQVYKKLKGRNRDACIRRANLLRLFCDKGKWTEDEDNILREFYPSMGPKVYKKLPGRTMDACSLRASKLEIIYRNSSRWTEDEDNILREFYPSMGPKVYKKLPGRTECACVKRAHRLNILCVNDKWTEDEIRILREFYPSMGKNIYNMLPGRTECACTLRASLLSIKSNLTRSNKRSDNNGEE